MSVREVSNLRKEGNLKEAYEMAYRELNKEPNEWTRMSMFWVLRDLAMKLYIPSQNIEKAQSCLHKMELLLPQMKDDDGIGEKAYQNLYKLILPNASEIKSSLDLSKTNPNKAYENVTTLFGTDAARLDPKLHEDFGWIIYRYIKANIEIFTSVQTRCLLRDYMQLKNSRPSLLHSMILNFAINFSKDHSDFNFYNFLILWGVNNLRNDDYHDGYSEGHKIPSLTSRICNAILSSKADFNVPEFISKFENQDIIIENLRQAFFWRLINLNKENKLEELYHEFEYYAENYSTLGPSHWHSEILKTAYRLMTNEHANKFIDFFYKWDKTENLRDKDWNKETNEEGNEFPSLAIRCSKKCFDLIKESPKDTIPNEIISWLKTKYTKIYEEHSDDDWNVRNYARICVWCNETEKAIRLYKHLLLHIGDKFYIWEELANLLQGRNDLKIGLLLKAKEVEHNEDFLGEIHLNLALLWAQEGYVTIAKKELEKYITHRKDKGWNVSDHFRHIQAIIETYENKSDYVDFISYINKAEDYVYEGFEWTDFVLTKKWSSDNVERCTLNDGKGININIKTKKFSILKNSEIGNIIQLKYYVTEENKLDTSLSPKMNRTSKIKKTIPLVARMTEKEPWSILPIKYGVIDYVNENKKMLHIITQSSEQTFLEYQNKPLPLNSFIKFREYKEIRNDETRTYIAKVELCSREEALQNMPNRVVVVDDVNREKELFHVVLGPGKISDIIRYNQTEIRPSIGDFLHIVYCIRINKEGKKRIKFLDIKTSDVGCKGVTGTIAGRLELNYIDRFGNYHDEPNFAFVKDFYVHRNLLKKYNIKNDCNVVAKVVLGGDDKWKVYDLELSEVAN